MNRLFTINLFLGTVAKIKTKKSLIVLVAILLLGLAGYAIYLAHLSYSGYCFEQKRFLTDDEKIRAVVREILVRYPKSGDVVHELKIVDGKRVWTKRKKWPESPVPYESIDHFLRLNPDCCSVSDLATYGTGLVKISVMQRVLGRASDFVRINYYLRYLDEKGNENKKLIQDERVVNQCAKPAKLN